MMYWVVNTDDIIMMYWVVNTDDIIMINNLQQEQGSQQHLGSHEDSPSSASI